ncbi:hypothetical protein BH10BAC5_BH10BAC5_01010 [soil metagenome]
MKIRSVLVWFVLIGFGSVLYINLTAFHDGYPGPVTKRPGGQFQGCICHGDTKPSPFVSVLIVGPSNVRPGDTASYVLKISGGPDSAAGCKIATFYGSLLTTQSDTALKYGQVQYYGGTPDSVNKIELNHKYPKLPTQDTIYFHFKYIAPNFPNGHDTIYANGNSVIVNQSTDDDRWNFAESKVINITTSGVNNNSVVVNDFKLLQNYPNPFNPSTNISFDMYKPGIVTLKVFDMNGKEKATLIDNKQYPSGNNNFSFDAGKYLLTSGLYFYKLESGSGSEIKKMMLIK